MAARITRRRFAHLSAGTLGYLFTGPAVSVTKVYGANDKLRVAGVGVGGKGSSDIDQAGRVMEVAAICDIDEQRLGKKGEAFPQAKKYVDYRKLYDEMLKQIDAVVVSTPDHTHAPAAVPAMRAGKHVYVQKPLTHTVFEARLMRETAAGHGVCTQMGNQGSALNGLRRAVELVHAGVLGAVTEAHVWTNRPAHYWKQAPDIVARPAEAPVPPHVHWDLFLGTAPARPYAVRELTEAETRRAKKAAAPGKKPAYHPHDWRGYWDFGTGAMGDMACHTANMAFRALKLGAPTTVRAECGEINPETYPAWAHITYTFPARGDMAACTLHWYEGKKGDQKVLPPDEVVQRALKVSGRDRLVESGSILVGAKGILYSPSDYGAEIFLGPGCLRRLGLDALEVLARAGTTAGQDEFMKKEWVEAIRAGKPGLASSNFDYAAQLTETMLLGNIAMRFAGQPLVWDAAALAFPSNPAATKLVTKEYRKGWELAGG